MIVGTGRLHFEMAAESCACASFGSPRACLASSALCGREFEEAFSPEVLYCCRGAGRKKAQFIVKKKKSLPRSS